MKNKYFVVAALALMASAICAVCHHLYSPDTPIYTEVIGVISGSLGAVIAFVWDDKRRKLGGKMEQNKKKVIGRALRKIVNLSFFLVFILLFSSAFAEELVSDGFASSQEEKNRDPDQGRWLLFEIRQSNEKKGYIFGVSHTLIDANELPSKVKKSILQSTSLVFEFNYFDANLNDQSAKILTSNPSGKTLKSMLLPHTYKKLQKIYEFENIPSEMQSQINLWSPYMAIAALEAKCTTIQAVGISPERTIDNFAIKEGMQIIGLESVDDQLGWLSKLSKKQWDDYFTAYSDWIMDKDCAAKFASSYKKISSYIFNGDVESISNEYMRFYSKDIPVKWFHEHYFLSARNAPLTEKMIKVLQNDSTPFFLIGAAHLGGTDGINQRLRNMGYEIEQIR